jgi:peptidyl-prolyl cis-trans isomerase SurA
MLSLTRILFVTLMASLVAPGQARAQEGLFDPVITVNDEVITRYELDQRARMLAVLNAPGDPETVAREQLIEDRLRVAAAADAGIRPSPEAVEEGMAEFAGRSNLDRDSFVAALAQAGVAEETFRDFVRAGVAWRSLVQARFVGRISVDEAAVDRALSAQAGGARVRVLLSEIIIPQTPENADQVRAVAAQIAEMTSFDAFSDAARQVSATPSRAEGGRLGWQPLDALPEPLRPIVLALKPGEVTEPLPIEGALALFQLRGIEEVGYSAPPVGAVEYAALYLPGGRSEATLAEAARIAVAVDRCDDLYGIAQDRPEEALERVTQPPAALPADIARELDALDPGEVSTALTRENGQVLVFLMLCGRSPSVDPSIDITAFTNALRNQRLAAQAEGYLAQLRAEARIVER